MQISRHAFPLPTLQGRLKGIERELIDGRGFVRLRGIDRTRYSREEMEMIYWGIGSHLGAPWPQNQYGHVLGDVTDQGVAPADPMSRGNEIGQVALPYHSDGSDLVGLILEASGGIGRDGCHEPRPVACCKPTPIPEPSASLSLPIGAMGLVGLSMLKGSVRCAVRY